MNEITYTDKVALNENASIPDINKVKADDMNEIKSVVNGNSQTSSNNFGLETNTWTSSGTYAIGDIVVYNSNTYKNLTGTNTATTPDQDSTNWEVIPLIIDEHSDSTSNAYCCNYTNKLHTYSTDETKTGETWIDGKPIYRKVITATSPNTASTYTTVANMGSGVVDTLIMANSIILVSYTSTNRVYYNLNIDERDNNHYGLIAYNKDNGNIQMNVGTEFRNQQVIIILKYTKTTD